MAGSGSPVQRGELVERGNPLRLDGMWFFAVGMKPVLLPHLLPPFRRVRAARVSSARVGTVFILPVGQLAGFVIVCRDVMYLLNGHP
jgi:hypothetical protein